METAVLFSRVSKKEQASDSKFERTLKQAQEYCIGGVMNKTGKTFKLHPHHFIHVGSAFHEDIRKSEAIEEIINLIDMKVLTKPVHLLVANTDRIDRRSLNKSLGSLTALCEHGIILHELRSGTVLDLVSESEDQSQIMMSVMYFIITLIRANDESESKSKRSRDVHRERKARAMAGDDFSYGGRLPRWIEKFDEKTKKWVLKKDEVFKIKYIFDQLAKGVTAYKLSKKLTELSKKDKRFQYINGKGIPSNWDAQTIKNLYTNRGVLGIKTFGESKGEIEEVENYYPPIVDHGLYNQVMDVLRSRMHKGKEPYEPSIFIYLCRCFYCDKAQVPSNSLRRRVERKRVTGPGRYYFFTCGGAMYQTRSCTHSRIKEHDLENVFLKFLGEIDISKILSPQNSARSVEIQNSINSLLESKNKLEINKKNLLKVLDGLTVDVADISRKLSSVENKLISLDAELVELEVEQSGLSSSNFTPKDQKQLLSFKNDTDEETIIKINQKLRRIIKWIELAPNGLPKKNSLKRQVGIAVENKRHLLYGTEFPAMVIRFKNGASRTIIWQRKNINNVLCVYNEDDNYMVDKLNLGESGTTMIIGSREFAEKKLGSVSKLQENIRNYLQAKQPDVGDVELKLKFDAKRMDRLIENTIWLWENPDIHKKLKNN